MLHPQLLQNLLKHNAFCQLHFALRATLSDRLRFESDVKINLLREKSTSAVFIIGSAVESARMGNYDAII